MLISPNLFSLINPLMLFLDGFYDKKHNRCSQTVPGGVAGDPKLHPLVFGTSTSLFGIHSSDQEATTEGRVMEKDV